MISYIVDASALVELGTGPAPDPDLRRRTSTGRGAAPEVIDLESLNTLRRMVHSGAIELEAAREAATAFRTAPVARVSHRPLLDRVWELRESITAYDAAYVALAERLKVPLLTCDGRLGRAHGHRAEIIAYPRS